MMYDRYVDVKKMLIQSLPQFKEAVPELTSVKSCVMIGCGYGNLELPFIYGDSGCLPNVTRLAAVEPDAEQMEELKARMARFLPNVTAEYYLEMPQSWKGSDRSFDAALLFETLQDVELSDRPYLMKKLHDNVMASGGFVIILVYPYSQKNPADGLGRFISRIGLIATDDIDVAQVQDTMTSVGFTSCCALPIECQLLTGDLADDFLSNFVYWTGGLVTLEKVRQVAKEEFGGMKTVPMTVYLLAFRKP